MLRMRRLFSLAGLLSTLLFYTPLSWGQPSPAGGSLEIEIPGQLVFYPGETFQLRVLMERSNVGVRFDGWLTVTPPSGNLLYLTLDGATTVPQPVMRNIPFIDYDAPIMTLPVPDNLPSGPYFFEAYAVVPGGHPGDDSHIITSDTALAFLDTEANGTASFGPVTIKGIVIESVTTYFALESSPDGAIAGTCALRAVVRNSTSSLKSLGLIFNVFDSNGSGVGFTSVTGLVAGHSTDTIERTLLTNSRGTLSSCSSVHRIELDPISSVYP